jgi:hypothetical protein
LTTNTLTLDQGATIVNSGADSLIFTEAGSRFAGDLRVSGAMYAQAAEVNGRIVLANDEYVVNDTDGDILVTFDDDAATLGELVLTTSLTKTALDPNNHMDIVFRANDGADNSVDWTKIVSTMTDTVNNSKDSKIGFTTYAADAAVTGLEITGGTLTLSNAATISAAHTDTLTITETNVKIKGGLSFSASPLLAMEKLAFKSTSGTRALLTINGVDYVLVAASDTAAAWVQ